MIKQFKIRKTVIPHMTEKKSLPANIVSDLGRKFTSQTFLWIFVTLFCFVMTYVITMSTKKYMGGSLSTVWLTPVFDLF